MATKSFRDLIVWQKSRDLAVIIYNLTEKLPDSEKYNLASQMRRAVVSISSNIAESCRRFHRKEKRQLLAVAYGSGGELESQIEVAKLLFKGLNCEEAEKVLGEVMRMLNSMLH